MEEKRTLTEWRTRGLFDTVDPTVPDAAEGERRKKEALAEMQRTRKYVLDGLRNRLVMKLKEPGVDHVTSDNARHIYEHDFVPSLTNEIGYAPAYKSFAGTLFIDKRFKATGQYVKSRYPKNHSAVIMTWRLA